VLLYWIQIEDLQKTIRPPSEERKKEGLEGFGVSQFEGVSEKVQGVSVKIGDPQFTLIWEKKGERKKNSGNKKEKREIK